DGITQVHRDSHEDPLSAPFLSYDQNTRLEGGDDEKARVVSELMMRLDGYIEYSQDRVSGFEIGLRCLPVEGIFPDDYDVDEDPGTQQLLEYDSDGAADDRDALESLQHLSTHWKPEDGDITILPRMYANEISKLTGTDLFARLAEKRYLLLNGDFKRALQKLSNLEPLLGSIKRSMTTESTMANGNILIWPTGVDKCTIEFVRIHHAHPAFSRIIVSQAEQNILQRKLLAEARHHVRGSTYQVPSNLQLQGVFPTKEIHGSKIWDEHTFDSFGSPSNVDPIISTGSTKVDQDRSTVGKPQNSKEARIAEWSNQVVHSADPDVAPEAPVEPAAERRRIVAVDSDSDEDELPVKHTPIPKSVVPDRLPTPPCLLDSYSEHELDFQASLETKQLAQDDFRDGMLPGSPLHSDEQPKHHNPSATVMTLSPFEAVDGEKSNFSPVEARSESPRQASSFPSSDPQAYGFPKRLMRGQRGGENRNRGGRSSRGPSNHCSSPLKSIEAGNSWSEVASPRGQRRGSAQSGRSSGRARGRAHYQVRQNSMPSEEQLIDIETPRPSRPTIPPGFESHFPLMSPPLASQDTIHPPQAIEQPRDRQGSSSSHEISSNAQSRASGDSHIRFSTTGADYCTSYVPKRNVDALRESKLAEMTARLQAGRISNKSTLKNKKAEEEMLPPSHSTMRQQGKNPGKGSSQETKAQKKERLLKAMADSYGDVPTAPVKLSVDRSNAEVISKAKIAQMKKSPAFAREHYDLAEKMQRDKESKKLVHHLKPLFELARRFPGRLDFEAQFGQVLISQAPQISDPPLHSQESWAEIFEPGKSGKAPSPTSFSRIMTTNGADVDRVLELKLPSGKTKVKVWSAPPGPSAVTYEFSCHSRSNEDFLIAINQKGQYQLHKGSITAGMINIHIPNQIWDASFVLMGNLNWIDPPEVLTKSVNTFVDSLYVLPGREKLMMVFRQPSDHEIEIRNLVVRRVSLHRCNLPGCEELQLKITEVKSLLFKKHPQDNNLWQGYENPHDDHKKLMQEGRVHYEMSLIHTGINVALARNESLEIGELTDPETTGKSLVEIQTITLMLDLVVKMVNRLDFVGMSNIGTLYRRQLQEEERQRNL
ncbi:uncharacterized protein A1O9_04336, partial [Exophiala aquamarina CBS 119918]